VSFFSILWLALGLAMDATAASAAQALARPPRVGEALFVAAFFGGFQAAMPAIGWFAGVRLGRVAADWDHWIAFTLLVGLGGKMLWEARGGDEAPKDAAHPYRVGVLLPLTIATSIDALAAGVTLPVLHAPMALSLATIGIVTAVLSLAGLYVGKRLGAHVGRKLDAVGGLALIAIGVKILADHLA
jgi:putative Mn2+ efflux pump MntP